MFCRPAYFKLIEECVTQIVLQRGGVDPDFRANHRFELDVDAMIRAFLWQFGMRAFVILYFAGRGRFRDTVDV